MKIYYAGSFSGLAPTQLRQIGINYKLYSYANDQQQIKLWGGKGLMLDSGAFTAYTKGITININELNAYIKQIQPDYAIQLDVIGNEQKTWENYLKQRQDIPNILPVIHYNATDKHIERVLNVADYVLLGGLVPYAKDKPKLIKWLDYLYGKHKLVAKKTHLLGITTQTILERYPIYSCDSSSALSIVRYPSSSKINIMKQKTKHYTELYEVGIKPIIQLETYITNLWEKRGIKWTD